MHYQITIASDLTLENFNPEEDLFTRILQLGATSLASPPPFAATLKTSRFAPKEKVDLLDGLISFFDRHNFPSVTSGGISELSFRCLLGGNGVELVIRKNNDDCWHVVVLTNPGFYVGVASGTVRAFLTSGKTDLDFSKITPQEQEEAVGIYTDRLLNTLFVLNFKA